MAPTFEHRKFYRADTVIKVEYKIPGKKKIEGIAFSKNVSATGLSVVMADSVKIGSRINIKMHIDGRSLPVAAKGDILWCDGIGIKTKSGKAYYSTGILITDMAPEDAIFESDFVRDILVKKSEAQTKSIIEKLEDL